MMLPLDKFFYPDSIAVIGASRKPGKVGHEILRILKENKDKGVFKGELFAINPSAKEILGVPTFQSISQLPFPPDLAVIAIPAKFVPEAVDELGKLGTRNVIVISGGFAEIGGEGVALQEELIRVARKHRVRVIGPNCIGIVCPESGVDTMFLPYEKEISGKIFKSLPRPKSGSISLITQSGAFGVACLDYMAGERLGLAKFISYGNRADVDEAELIDYLASDYKTRVILVYIESLGRGKEFIEAARRAVLSKPIVVLKAARTKSGVRAALSHTAAVAGRDDIYDAAFRQAGIIRVDNVEELFDVAKALSMQPPAKGKRIAVLTDGGGAGVMAVDELERRGLIIADFSEETWKRLDELKRRGIIPPIASIKNPVDLTGSTDDEAYVRSLEVLLESPVVDGVIVIALHHVPGLTGDLPEKLADVARGIDKPVVFCDIGQGGYATAFRERFEELGFPAYPTPERAAIAMSALATYGEIRIKFLEAGLITP